MRSAYSMARVCEEVVFIPSKRVCLTVVEDLAKMQIPRNAEDAESVLAETQFNNKTIDDLLLQLQGYMKFWLYLVVCEYPYKKKKPFEKGISPLSKGKLAN